ncbi:hypothetical protein [Saccharothrix saharensis]|uniref:hypothetical protein n=1 Tax=Saccharothrix saharensis TaxID=571190 RepID=UPI00114F6BD5|nr:hypothetical protein [Saccharothrix saharensis]
MRRVAGHLRRGTSRPPPGGPKRWLKAGIAAVVTTGAVATAITAVLSVKLPSDPEDSAAVTAVRATSRVPLGEYVRRSENTVPKKFGGGRATSARSGPTGGSTAVTSSGKSPPTTRFTGTSTSSTGRTASKTVTAPSTSPSTGRLDPEFRLPRGLSEEDVVELSGTILLSAGVDVPGNGAPSVRLVQRFAPMVVGNAVDPQGNPAPPRAIVDRVLKLLGDSRKVEGGHEPVGVVVSADVELVGLRGKPVMLTWSMWQTSGESRLHGDWLNSNLAYRLEARTHRDTASVDLWVPLPHATGSYFVRVDLTSDGSRLASAESPPFD